MSTSQHLTMLCLLHIVVPTGCVHPLEHVQANHQVEDHPITTTRCMLKPVADHAGDLAGSARCPQQADNHKLSQATKGFLEAQSGLLTCTRSPLGVVSSTLYRPW